MSKNSPDKVSSPDQVKYSFYTYQISDLEGKLLTLIEASIQDLEQRRALKGIIRQSVWGWAVDNNCEKAHTLGGQL